MDGQDRQGPPRAGAPCKRSPVPYRPLPDPLPEIEQVTDESTGRRSYRVPGDAYYPSVTTVLGATASMEPILDWKNSVGADVARHIAGTQAAIGTEVHERLSMYVRGLNAWKGYASEWDRPIDVRGHYDQLVAYACSRLAEVVASEAPVWSDTLSVAGSVDLIAVLDGTWGDASGKRAVVDFKCLRSTPAPDKTASYLAQCAAYAVMWTERTGQAVDRIVVAQSIASGGGVKLAVAKPGGKALEEFLRRRIEFDSMGIKLPGRDYEPGCSGGNRAAARKGDSGKACPSGSDAGAGAGAGNTPVRPFVVWTTGLPSSGKTTILRELHRRIPRMIVVGGEEIREWCAATDHTRIGRARHAVRIARLVGRLYRSGVPVGVSMCNPYPENRACARGIIGADGGRGGGGGGGGAHIECYVKCPPSVCEKRDRHGLYEAARAGHAPWLTGVCDPYVPPESPDIVVDSERDDAATSASRIHDVLRARGLA